MLKVDRLEAISDAIAEIDAGMVDIATVVGTTVSIVPNHVLDELEAFEVKYIELRKVLGRLDAHTKQELPSLKLNQVPSRVTVDAYRNFRDDVIRILRGKELKR